MRGLFVTGTDTDVGKTVVTAGIVAALRARGLDAGIAKAVQAGAARDDRFGDAALLARWSGVEDGLEAIAPWCFEAPLAPVIAARRAGTAIELEACIAALTQLGARHECLVVEGAGGLLVPVGASWTIADLVVGLGLGAVVVARATLGTVNHTLLTVEALRRRAVHIVGVIVNGARDDSSSENVAMIEHYGSVRVLGEVPLATTALDASSVAELIRANVDVDVLWRAASRDNLAEASNTVSDKEFSCG